MRPVYNHNHTKSVASDTRHLASSVLTAATASVKQRTRRNALSVTSNKEMTGETIYIKDVVKDNQ
jgi:hypothetical protein